MRRLLRFTWWGALIDLGVFLVSFVFFGGGHGPIGPMLVLGILNAPGREAADRLWPAERTTSAIDALLMFVVVVVNGALYGAIVGGIVEFRRFLTMRRRRSPRTY
jgi:hypothetical protein